VISTTPLPSTSRVGRAAAVAAAAPGAAGPAAFGVAQAASTLASAPTSHAQRTVRFIRVSLSLFT